MGLDNPLHILFLLLVVLLVFGAKRLPELGRSLGSGMRGFRDALSGADSQAPALVPATHGAPALAGEDLAAASQPAVTAASAALPASPPAHTQP
jgi:sec-independent protein translocase protein TatA